MRGGRDAAGVKADKLYLVGFMGAGKTTVARAVARRIGWQFEDVDERIESRERRTVASIFAQNGEPHFRALERQMLMELLPERNMIVATGGGTFVDPVHRPTLPADGAGARREVPLARLIERVPSDGRRPLAADRAAMEQLFQARQAAY